jgi:hypothetical protein
MRNICYSLFFLSEVCYGQSQVVNFDSLSFPMSQNYWNGSDLSGGFSDKNVVFNNDYDTTYQFWMGFAYSSVTDSTTAGITNQYAAFPKSGANGSANYGVWYSSGLVTFPSIAHVDSIKVSNATYTALSMRDGDSYGKKFGSNNNAGGMADGTNGEDWCKLTIYGINEADDTVGAVDFYLADYRFSDNAQDYIVDSWENVDLSALGAIKKLAFEISSSDVGQFGMNTPDYFVIDDIAFHSSTASLTENSTTSVGVYPNPATSNVHLSFASSKPRTIQLINASGSCVEQFETENSQLSIETTNLNRGVYFIIIQSVDENIFKKLMLQ